MKISIASASHISGIYIYHTRGQNKSWFVLRFTALQRECSVLILITSTFKSYNTIRQQRKLMEKDRQKRKLGKAKKICETQSAIRQSPVAPKKLEQKNKTRRRNVAPREALWWSPPITPSAPPLTTLIIDGRVHETVKRSTHMANASLLEARPS